MIDFSNLDHLNPKADQAVEYELDITGLDTPIVLRVRPALSVNKPFLNDQAKLHAQMQRKMGRKGQLTASGLEEMRSAIRRQYAKHIVVGWENVLDAAGDEVPFNPDHCHQFLMMLPDEMFDELADFCRDPDSFLEVVDAEDLGKS